ncbi:serine/threonine protein kinase [Pseudonocardia sp. SID8383]|uniref:serine/threonine protein kinase n=1 Tax=Pseudonocardia sp. SID8383 TaxID=2690363 RepID=UPI001371191B|nr:protein kinase [Pseudonocardia sp. SID8383]MYW71072.1 protein kinase [Pseudonocardia sp. SID8383]
MVDELIEQAASRLGVTDLTSLRDGGQKVVRAGRRGDELVVLKVIEVRAPQQQVLERARREVGLLGEVDDLRLVGLRSPIIGLGPDEHRPDGVAWLEERLDGHDLDELFGSAWSGDDVTDLLVGLSEALQILHGRAVVHRDLSPGNVRRRSSGVWTLMDPGYAKHLAAASITGVYQPGTRGFRSPEHLPGATPDTYSDVYAVGILAYIAATTYFPVDHRGAEDEYYERLRAGAVVPVNHHRPDLPAEIALIIDTCLHRQPARRYLDATELLAALTAGAVRP